MSSPVSSLRIAVLNRVFSPTGGGAERYSIALVEQLAARHEIHVFAQQVEHVWPGVTYHKVSSPLTRPRWLNQFWYAAATWWSTRKGYDIVHSHESTWQGQVQTVHVLPMKYSLFNGQSGFSLVLRTLNVLTSPRLLAYLLLERMRFAPLRGRCVVVTSPMLKEVVAETYPASRLAVVLPGVNFPDDSCNRQQARARLKLPPDGKLLAFIANDYGKKGLTTLLEALVFLPQDVILAVVGNPRYIKEFSVRADQLGVGPRVHFLGHLRDVTPLYQAADALAHPTLEDTFAMVVLEAMAYGVPVVISDERYCGIAGLLDNGVNALILSSPLNARELADALGVVVRDQALHDQLAAGARQFAEGLSWKAIARQQEAVYFDILSGVRNHLEKT